MQTDCQMGITKIFSPCTFQKDFRRKTLDIFRIHFVYARTDMFLFSILWSYTFPMDTYVRTYFQMWMDPLYEYMTITNGKDMARRQRSTKLF